MIGRFKVREAFNNRTTLCEASENLWITPFVGSGDYTTMKANHVSQKETAQGENIADHSAGLSLW